jgi:serine/threonine-protein kinase
MDISLRENGVYRFGAFTLDPLRRALFRQGERVKLPERLFDVLLYLVVNHGRLVERDELLQAVWAGRTVEDSNVSQAIFALRRALQASGASETTIVTVPGRGFRFAEPVVFEPELAGAMPAEPVSSLPIGGRRGPTTAVVAILALALAVASLGLAVWRNGQPAPARSSPAEAEFSPPPHSIAVLAFDNLSGDPGQAYLSDGLSEQLINALTQIDALQVAGRTSSFSFRGSHATVGQIGRALNVGAVLAGSVRRAGNRVVVTAQLTNALTGFNLWSRSFDRDQADIVTVQTDIALKVAQLLQVALPGDEAAKLTLGGTTNAAAYDAFLRGVRLRRGARVEADYRAALAEFDHALSLDPGFAQCQAKRSLILTTLATMGTADAAEKQRLVQAAVAAADRAVALAPMLGDVHNARGGVLGFGLLDHAGALAEQIRARALEPGNPGIESNYALAELYVGHVGEAVEAARRATELDPLGPDQWGQLALVLFEAHRYAEALVALDRETAVTGTLPQRHRVLRALVLLMQGHAEAARSLCAAGNGWLENQVLAIADHALGRPAAAEADMAKMRADLGDGGTYNYAETYAQWGNQAAALEALEEAVRQKDPGMVDILTNPLLDPIRGQSRFKEIVAGLGAG